MAPIKLDAKTVAKLREAQRDLHDILPEFDKLEQCGEDCQIYRQVHAEAGQRIEALLKHYG